MFWLFGVYKYKYTNIDKELNWGNQTTMGNSVSVHFTVSRQNLKCKSNNNLRYTLSKYNFCIDGFGKSL